jgi:hypothetical protein
LNGEVVNATQYEMVNKFGVHQSNLIEVIAGKRKSVDGWTLLIIHNSHSILHLQ